MRATTGHLGQRLGHGVVSLPARARLVLTAPPCPPASMMCALVLAHQSGLLTDQTLTEYQRIMSVFPQR